MKREEFQKIVSEYREENGCQEFLWAMDDELFSTVKRDKKHFRVEQIMAQGDFRGTFDYDRGLLVVKIYTLDVNWSSNTKYGTVLLITNIDDGSWRATSKEFTNAEDANELSEKLSVAFFKEYRTKLPDEKELNEFLRPFGLWGHSEG